MERTYITITEYCSYNQVEPDFVMALVEGGILQLRNEQNEPSIDYEELEALERYRRLRYDLDINIQGLSAIHHLLDKMQQMQFEMKRMENAITFYEQGKL